MNDGTPSCPTPGDEVVGTSRLPGVGTTIFTVMSRLATEHRAVNLGQGFPDFDCEPGLQRLVGEEMAAGRNQYAPMAGVPALREAVSEKIARRDGIRYDPEREITITAGATQALLTAVLAAMQPGDEAIQLEPAYDSYAPSVELAGGRLVPVPLDHARGYSVDWDRVRAAITPRTRLLFLNSPHNPTGALLSRADLETLASILEGTRVLVVSDEVYEHIVFDGHRHASVSSVPALAARAFVVSSFGKTYHCTGWKIGTCCAPAALMAEFRKVHQFNVFAVNHPVQSALARWMRESDSAETLPAFYQEKRDHFVAGLARTRFRSLATSGSYFVLADYSAISSEPEEAFARRLVIEHGVATIPVAPFYRTPFNHRLVRFCFGKRLETLDAALERLAGT